VRRWGVCATIENEAEAYLRSEGDSAKTGVISNQFMFLVDHMPRVQRNWEMGLRTGDSHQLVGHYVSRGWWGGEGEMELKIVFIKGAAPTAIFGNRLILT
jgi:hypothetical protein